MWMWSVGVSPCFVSESLHLPCHARLLKLEVPCDLHGGPSACADESSLIQIPAAPVWVMRVTRAWTDCSVAGALRSLHSRGLCASRGDKGHFLLLVFRWGKGNSESLNDFAKVAQPLSHPIKIRLGARFYRTQIGHVFSVNWRGLQVSVLLSSVAWNVSFYHFLLYFENILHFWTKISLP